MLNVTIREATSADAEAVAAVNASAVAKLRETYRPNQAALANKSAIADALTRLVAEHDGRVVGCVEYSLADDRLHFLSLGVQADVRRQGIARQLIDELARIGRRAGAQKLSTYTVTQTGNVAIFERMGFHVVSEEPSPYFESDRFENITETYFECRIQ